MADLRIKEALSILPINTVNDKDMETFRYGLMNYTISKTIKRVTFKYSTFGVVGMKHLCESLDLLPNLECLSFAFNQTIYENIQNLTFKFTNDDYFHPVSIDDSASIAVVGVPKYDTSIGVTLVFA